MTKIRLSLNYEREPTLSDLSIVGRAIESVREGFDVLAGRVEPCFPWRLDLPSPFVPPGRFPPWSYREDYFLIEFALERMDKQSYQDVVRLSRHLRGAFDYFLELNPGLGLDLHSLKPGSIEGVIKWIFEKSGWRSTEKRDKNMHDRAVENAIELLRSTAKSEEPFLSSDFFQNVLPIERVKEQFGARGLEFSLGMFHFVSGAIEFKHWLRMVEASSVEIFVIDSDSK